MCTRLSTILLIACFLFNCITLSVQNQLSLRVDASSFLIDRFGISYELDNPTRINVQHYDKTIFRFDGTYTVFRNNKFTYSRLGYNTWRSSHQSRTNSLPDYTPTSFGQIFSNMHEVYLATGRGQILYENKSLRIGLGVEGRIGLGWQHSRGDGELYFEDGTPRSRSKQEFHAFRACQELVFRANEG